MEVVAHTLNNLLTVIAGFAQTLAASLDEDDVRREDAERIHAAAIRACELADRILAAGKAPTREARAG